MNLVKWLKRYNDGLFRKVASDGAELSGEFELEFKKPDGQVFATRNFDNIILEGGEEEVASLLGGLGGTAFNTVAIGTDSTAETKSDASLMTEVTSGGGSRASASVSTGSYPNVTVFEYTWTFTSSFAIQEVGITNDTTVGSETAWLTRKTFATVNVETDDQLAVNYKITAGVDRS